MIKRSSVRIPVLDTFFAFIGCKIVLNEEIKNKRKMSLAIAHFYIFFKGLKVVVVVGEHTV